MTKGGRKKRLFGVGTLLLGVAALTACPEQDPVDEILAPGTEGEAVANFLVSSGDGFGRPGASYNTPGLTDAFGRATGATGFYNNSNPFAFPTYNFDLFIRSAADDPRLPALDAATSGTVGGLFCLLGDGNWTGDDFWDFWCRFEGVKPNTRYTVVMAQLYLVINGELDADQILRGEAVTEPDELRLLPGGSPGGFPDVLCDFSVEVTIPAAANPFVFGYADSDANGRAEPDCLGFADGSSWYGGAPDDPVAGQLPVMPNEPFSVPQPVYTYNYIYLVEGQGTAQDPVPSGPIAARIQIGPDLRSDGLPHFNAYAPFPTAASAATPLPELSLTAGPLARLSGNAVYQLWLLNGADQTALPLTAREIVQIDTEAGTEETIATDAAAAVQGGGLNDAFRFDVFMADNPGAFLDYDHVLLTVESSSGATQPSNVVALYKKYADVTDPALPVVSGVGSLEFGNFDVATTTPGQVWGFAGSGIAHFFGDEFRARVENIARPPVGFAYYGWLVGTDDQNGTVYHALGPVTVDNPPDYTPLVDADITRDIPSAESSVVAATFIARGMNRALVGAIPTLQSFNGEHPFCNVTNYWITLEPKAGDLTQPSPTVAITGASPETFLTSAICR